MCENRSEMRCAGTWRAEHRTRSVRRASGYVQARKSSIWSSRTWLVRFGDTGVNSFAASPWLCSSDS